MLRIPSFRAPNATKSAPRARFVRRMRMHRKPNTVPVLPGPIRSRRLRGVGSETGHQDVPVSTDAAPASADDVEAQVLARIAAGELTPGTRLPTVRAFAADTGLAVNTVAKAYRRLEERGAIETRGRAGTFVAWSSDAGAHEVEAAAVAYAELTRRHGVTPTAALDLIRAALGD
jgi:DNA-binding transcriptional regulator YhcF (GntR family)